MAAILGKEDHAPRPYFRIEPSSTMAKPQAAAVSAECKLAPPTNKRPQVPFRVSKPHATLHTRRHKYQKDPLQHTLISRQPKFNPLDNNMDCNTKIDEILAKINSIHDLDSDIVAELRATAAERFSVEKFLVEPWDWREWSEKHQEIRGIEYDAQNSRIRIKASSSPLHEAATRTIGEWLLGVRDSLNKITKNEYDCIGSEGVDLGSDYFGSEKAPDEGLCHTEKRFPLIAVEVAVSETSKKVFEDATRWLKGSGGDTKLVIVVDIKEKISNTAKTTDWGLPKDVLGRLDSTSLTEHILQWHRNNNSSLIGTFEAFFYLCFQNQQPRQVWKCEFSRENEPEYFLEGADYITTKELIPELKEFDCYQLPFQELSTKMKKRLIKHELKRASHAAGEKVKEMRKIRGQKENEA